jgi:hypothetical protein
MIDVRGQPIAGTPRRGRHVRKRLGRVGMLSVALTAALVAAPSALASSAFTLSQVTDISNSCAGQNAEVEQAVDPSLHYVYEDWMGCTGIAFAVSTDGGSHFHAPISLPGTVGSNTNVWDPAVTVAPTGIVYASFMRAKGGDWYPVVAASFDHGQTFAQVSALAPPVHKNWGDRDFIAVGPDGSVYVTWDYGPERTSVTYICTTGGSCAFATGDLNVVIQKSTDGGRTWGPIIPVSPGFPASGGDSAPLVVEPSGRIDVLYQGYHITNTTTYTMTPAHSYFTSSSDGGQTWSSPVLVGADHPELTMSLSEWWIDGAIAMDSAGNLYATWDTQGASQDVGWLSFSTDHGAHWSNPVRVTPDADNAAHIVEVAGGGAGVAYVGWLTNASPNGYSEYLREFSVSSGWLTSPIRVSGNLYGAPPVWPGDTFGISTLPVGRVVLTWGSGVSISGQAKSEIFATTVQF